MMELISNEFFLKFWRDQEKISRNIHEYLPKNFLKVIAESKKDKKLGLHHSQSGGAGRFASMCASKLLLKRIVSTPPIGYLTSGF